MSDSERLFEIEEELASMGVTEQWALEHMRISALEEAEKGYFQQPKSIKYALYQKLFSAKSPSNISEFYSKIDKLIDEKIILLSELLPSQA